VSRAAIARSISSGVPKPRTPVTTWSSMPVASSTRRISWPGGTGVVLVGIG
jgi:hypothetical protein